MPWQWPSQDVTGEVDYIDSIAHQRLVRSRPAMDVRDSAVACLVLATVKNIWKV